MIYKHMSPRCQYFISTAFITDDNSWIVRVGQKINVGEAPVAMATQNHGAVSAPDELLRGLTGEVSRDDVYRMLDIQQRM